MFERRYDLDWLRVMVFALLIFYHIGMLYVADWGFHFKSQYQSEFLQNIMLLVNRWRLPLLFIISGISIRFFLLKVNILRFLWMRNIRLLIPLTFGILVIVPPQLYIEMVFKGDLQGMSYWQFYQAFFDLDNPIFANYQSGILPHMDVNHLWYIRELWWFSILLIILTPLLNNRWIQASVSWIGKTNSIVLLLLPAVILSLLALLAFPGSNEGFRIAMGFSFLLIGYLIGWNKPFWDGIKQHRRVFLYVAVFSSIVLIWYYHQVFKIREIPLQGWQNWQELFFSFINRWSWLLMILAYGATYLNRPSSLLKYLNEAVYPYYILHQTLLIVAAFILSFLSLGTIIEPVLVVIITFVGCAIGFEIIRRFKLTRLLFGLKLDFKGSKKQAALIYVTCTLLSLPIAYEIIF